MAGRSPDGQLYIDLLGFDRSGVALGREDAMASLVGISTPEAAAGQSRDRGA